jgi:predicted transposase YbfD/YdcC
MLAIEGAIVTIDAMGKAGQRFRQAQSDGMARRGCQHDIAQKILEKKADYVLALKGNQGSLREDVELFAEEQKA